MLLHMQRQKHRMHWENNSLLEQGSRSTLQMLFTSRTVILTRLDVGDNQCYFGDHVIPWFHMSTTMLNFFNLLIKWIQSLSKRKSPRQPLAWKMTLSFLRTPFHGSPDQFWFITGPFPVDETVHGSVFLCSELISFICVIFMSLWIQMKCHLIKIILQKIRN